VVFDAHQIGLSQTDEERLHADLDALARQVEHFPVADLHVLLEGNARSNEVTVKLTLKLPGKTLVSHDHDIALVTAFERAVDSLVASLEAYKQQLGQVTRRQKTEKGTHHEIHAEGPLDAEVVDDAAAQSDYAAYRRATLPMEEALRKRVGRWVQRYPEFEARIGKGVEIEDVVEDVFLMAFENHAHRPLDVPYGLWLEGFIDRAVKALLQGGDAEKENMDLIRAGRQAEQP
jgi:ribosome-associated translation inhibitor RaiA